MYNTCHNIVTVILEFHCKPKTPSIPYRPALCPASQPAAFTAPRAKIMRFSALWVSSIRSSSLANMTV